MTSTSPVRAYLISLMVLAVLGAAMAGELLARFITAALTTSKQVRVAPLSACPASNDGVHFTGCSSVL